MNGATKSQLQQMLANIKKDIQTIDEKSIYSISYIFYNEGETRERLLAQLAQIEVELMYIADDEKRNKYSLFLHPTEYPINWKLRTERPP